ncbi:DoxX family membrane protein [Streptomyces sp. NPDC057638]|uniref:DoxX family membrane protein n=1 Tax=Streptomyces sp. NPDC057638 TaxID=3346190 RepID=UPI0036BAFBDC
MTVRFRKHPDVVSPGMADRALPLPSQPLPPHAVAPIVSTPVSVPSVASRSGARRSHARRSSEARKPWAGPRWAEPALKAALQRYRPHSTTVLRVSVGLIFLWFGVMKFIPQTSPAEDVATRTMDVLSFGLVPPGATLPLLALFESAIGLGLITGVLLRLVLAAFFVHMAGVFSALLVLPGEMWDGSTGAPTLEGQYIIKNVVLIAACLTVAADRRERGASRSR